MNNNQQTIKWAKEYLHINGYEILDEPKIIRDMPWSKITCFNTLKGRIFLKSMANVFSIEPKILSFLHTQITQKVPNIIALNKNLSCFLMYDLGVPLRHILNENFDIRLLCNAIKIYTEIQIKTIPHVSNFAKIGINDWRLKQLPTLYNNFMNQKELLLEDGLMLSEIKLLQQVKPKFKELCHQLALYNIPETIEHNDFHDNNILIKDEIITINDWGDASLSHPFFSLVSLLDSTKRNHHLKDSDPYILNFQKTYLEQWKNYGTEDQLLKAFELATQIRYFVFALSFARVKSCDGIELFPEYNGYIAKALRDFILSIH